MRFLCTERKFPSCLHSWSFTRGTGTRPGALLLPPGLVAGAPPGEITLSLPVAAALPGDFGLLLGTPSNQTLPSPLQPTRPI